MSEVTLYVDLFNEDSLSSWRRGVLRLSDCEPAPVRTGSRMGPPQKKRARRVVPISFVILAREWA